MGRRLATSRQVRATALGLAALVLLTAGIGASVALMLAPAVLMVLLLAAGLRPGEELIERLRTRFERSRARATLSTPRPRLVLVVRRVGGDLASALAMRPPPRAAFSHRL